MNRAHRIHNLTRELYDAMPGAPPVPVRVDGKDILRNWPAVESTQHFAFCLLLATKLVDVDVRYHVERD